MTYSGHFLPQPCILYVTIRFNVLILHLTPSFSCVNNLMHISANYSCDSRAVLIDMTRDLCIILFIRSLLKLSHELYLHLHMCSLLSLMNVRSLLYLMYMCSLLKCEYLFCNNSLSLFVILWLELQCVYHVDFHVLRNKWYIYIWYTLFETIPKICMVEFLW